MRLKCNTGFYCAYSPERINPGDKEHTIDKIKKSTSGSTDRTAELVDKIYSRCNSCRDLQKQAQLK